MKIIKPLLKTLHPLLARLYGWYASKPRKTIIAGIRIQVEPGVFHPGFFFSTKIFLGFLKAENLKNKKVLELGCGTGLISIFSLTHGASYVVASDMSKRALSNTILNAKLNYVKLETIHSDLFDKIDPDHFDYIIINPPYYPRQPIAESDLAWYCGESFEYFEKLFVQLKEKRKTQNFVLMILSEDCDIRRIKLIGLKNGMDLHEVHKKTMFGELNIIFSIIEI